MPEKRYGGPRRHYRRRIPYTAQDHYCPRCHRIHAGPHAGERPAEQPKNTTAELCSDCRADPQAQAHEERRGVIARFMHKGEGRDRDKAKTNPADPYVRHHPLTEEEKRAQDAIEEAYHGPPTIPLPGGTQGVGRGE